ncbi:Oligogalacturonate lyase [Acidisarcina polymorpha]|uniref:Oligogalacturonate lyase n=1 Tax=Acidisarcina polymorpha TaxID=2211140 RepID=A0A2Z5FTJ1_9BACT|nr:oligogalacturonate lyase family protein [Acidisarcina polymorpha]AXC09755.1 Oligogalacturonate lyase [Acidisarcina polymorpha]
MNQFVSSACKFSRSLVSTRSRRTAVRFVTFMLVLPVVSGCLSPGRAAATPAAGAQAPPSSSADSYVDPMTGHKVVRLSREPGRGSYSIYFHQNVFTGTGDKVVWTHINAGPGQSLWSTDISGGQPFGSGKSTHLADTIRLLGFPVVGKQSRDVYYINDHSILATNLDTLKTRTIATTPADWDMSVSGTQGLSINADETLLAGAVTTGADKIGQAPAGASSAQAAAARQNKIQATFQAHLPSFLYTVDLRSGKINVILRGTDWYDHVQFSPTDPNLMLFDYEGPWDKTDRLHLIHADGSGLVSFRPKQTPTDAVGHEFWGPDGQTIWFDLSQNNGKGRFLTGRSVQGGAEKQYAIEQPEFSRHYNISHSGKIFVGDGDTGGSHNPMIQLLLPQPNGTLQQVPLASVAQNDYSKREPNVIFTPDDQWVIYSSTQSGQSEVYAVSVNK